MVVVGKKVEPTRRGVDNGDVSASGPFPRYIASQTIFDPRTQASFLAILAPEYIFSCLHVVCWRRVCFYIWQQAELHLGKLFRHLQHLQPAIPLTDSEDFVLMPGVSWQALATIQILQVLALR